MSEMPAEIVCGFGCGCDHDPGRLCVYEARFMGREELAHIIRNHRPIVDRHDGTAFCPSCYTDEGRPRNAPCEVYRLAARLAAVEAERDELRVRNENQAKILGRDTHLVGEA